MVKKICNKSADNNHKSKCEKYIQDEQQNLRTENAKIDVYNIKNVVKILKENDLAKIKYECNGIKISITAQPSAHSQLNCQPMINSSLPLHPTANKLPSDEQTTESVVDYTNHPGAIKSPMVGTCYLAPEPNAAKFVNNGDTVKKDQPLLIIEAMKVMNYIKSPKDGRITHIAVEDAQPVEFGQLLMVIE